MAGNRKNNSKINTEDKEEFAICFSEPSVIKTHTITSKTAP